jgi:hypothetical protein
MNKLKAFVAAAAVAAPLSAFAYTQEDANACTPDAFRLCQSAIPDESRVAYCLAQNKPRLTPACAVVFSRPVSTTDERAQPGRVEQTRY